MYGEKQKESNGIVESVSDLSTESIKGAALSLQRVNDIKRGDGLALRMLGISDCVADDGFKERFEDDAGFFVDHCRKKKRLEKGKDW